VIPVTVVTGFLGAGKSTLVQKWLSELPREETAVIVNERGQVGIDGELLSAHVARLREITGGCVCCSSQAELVSALEELSKSSPRPKRLLIETSGAASPAGVIRAIGRGDGDLRLDGVVTVLDVTRAREALAFDLTVEQLGFADIVVMSHVDKAISVDVEDVEATARHHAPAAVVARARNGELDAGLIELLAQRVEALHLPAEAAAHQDIQAVSLMVNADLDDERFADWMERELATVEARILRIKGILAMKGVDCRVIVQGVGHAVEVQLGAPWCDAARTSRMVILGLALDADRLEAGFRRCSDVPQAATVGVAEHGNSAVLVTVAPGGVLVDRRRIDLTEDLPTHPYHHEGAWAVGRYLNSKWARPISLPEAVDLIERVHKAAASGAREALQALARAVSVPIGSISLRVCPDLPPSIEERVADNRAQSVADSVMYRQALATAAKARGWSVHWYDRKAVFDEASAALERDDIKDFVNAMGRPIGPPWQARHKLAAAAAIAVAGLGPDTSAAS